MEESRENVSSDEARTALDEVEKARETNADRLRRPGRHWIMVGSFLAIFTLQPLIIRLFEDPWSYFAAPALILIVAIAFTVRAPKTKRNYPLRGAMVWQLLGYALVCGIISGFSTATYNEHGIWWIPVISALVIFLVGAKGGHILDRSFARQASGLE